MLRIAYRLEGLGTRLRRLVQRRFTAGGLAIGLCLFIVLFASADTDNSVQYQALALLFGIVLVALGSAPFFRLKFSATRHLPRFATAGCPVVYSVTITNLSRRPQSNLSLFEGLTHPRPSYAEWRAAQAEREAQSFRLAASAEPGRVESALIKEAAVPPITPGGSVQVSVEVTPLRRGVLRFETVTLARPDPLGLFRSLASLRLPQSLLVLPRRYHLPPFAMAGGTRYQQGGVAQASRVGQSEDFAALRDYRRGDPLRYIHWRSWAKVGKPVVKELEDEFFVRHALVLDTFTRPGQAQVFEEAVSVSASFVSVLQTQESLLDLLFVGAESYCFTSGRSVAHEEQMLEVLASVIPAPGKSFRTLESLVMNHIRRVSGCVCVFVAWDEERREFIRKLKALGIPVLVLVVAAPRAGNALDPGPMRDQPDRFQVLEPGKIQLCLDRLGAGPPAGTARPAAKSPAPPDLVGRSAR